MFDHIGLHVKNLAASVAFYEAALAPFGYELCSRDETSAGLGRPGEPALWLYASKTPGAAHVAFKANDRRTVDRFHQRGAAAGGRDHGAPGLRADYAPTYYAAFLIDPDGNNVEAVCMEVP
ncbi:MAG TPA: VOC family protein [Kofleriaceae bacterium]|nr:VOC family protein [Kofleriaceae bacterium]